MAPSIADIVKDSEFDPATVDRIAHRKFKPPVEIVPYNPQWPQDFANLKATIEAGVGDAVLEINHSGSTSVPGLPAKDVIDIDLVVRDIEDEASYVPALEAAGYHFLFREPNWHAHRFLVLYEPKSVNLHVFGPDCAEVERHRIFKEWLLAHDDDRAAYVVIKEDAARQTRETGGDVQDYNTRKEEVIRGILRKAFAELGYI